MLTTDVFSKYWNGCCFVKLKIGKIKKAVNLHCVISNPRRLNIPTCDMSLNMWVKSLNKFIASIRNV